MIHHGARQAVGAGNGAASPAPRSEIVRFTPELLAPVRRFSERYWSRPRTDDYYEWRYLRSQPFCTSFLALRGEECLGMVSALRKPYRVAGRSVKCLEAFDWHVLPELRGSGLGIRLMRAMMREPEPVVSVGGSADALRTLPPMGWSRIGVARHFELPLSGELLAARLRRRVGVSRAIGRIALAPLSAAYYAPRRRCPPRGGSVTIAALPGDPDASLHEGDIGYSFAQEPEPHVLRWVSEGRWSGRYGFLLFAVGGRPRGWAMTRLYQNHEGVVGDIVEIFAPRPDVATYTWMVSEVALSLRAARPWRLRASASCPVLQAALLANRFRVVAGDVLVHTWPAAGGAATEHAHITLHHADGSFRPFDSEAAVHDTRAPREASPGSRRAGPTRLERA